MSGQRAARLAVDDEAEIVVGIGREAERAGARYQPLARLGEERRILDDRAAEVRVGQVPALFGESIRRA